MAIRNLALGVAAAAVLFVFGTMASFKGAATCHVDLHSAAQAPHLCATAGNSVTLSVSAMLGPGLVVLLLLVTARRRTIAYLTGFFLAADVVLFAVWGLVADGSLRY
ncbi:MAG TPA: hypothetical protein VI142_08175 [Gaiellaceae bacterium]